MHVFTMLANGAGVVLPDGTVQHYEGEMGAERGGSVCGMDARYCIDNGAMIAYTGALRLLAGSGDEHLAINTRARWPLDELPPISTP